MSVFCSNCGKEIDETRKFCPYCGYSFTAHPQPAQPVQPQVQAPVPQPQIPAQQPPVQPPVEQPVQQPAPPAPPPKKQKKKKKHKLPWILRFIIANVIIFGVLFGIWYGFGNVVTLYLHSEEVLETLNSGSLELAGTESAYDRLPNYIKKMMGDEYFEKEYGPITTAVLPYIKAERAAIHGFFGSSAVSYTISAPDLESWLLSLDFNAVTDENQLMDMMREYLKNAPRRYATVRVEYARESIFSIEWRGNYYTREFADAVCGGFNSAYNVLYQRAIEEYWAGFYNYEEAE